jgi:NNP family nitrate/nitrite transporter-like MFS transporter
VISLLYIGTFGSFIGFAFAFGQVLQINFAAGGQSAAQASLHAAQIAFIGPLLGSLSRVYGGKLADRIGGGKVTLYCFIAMAASASILVIAGMSADANGKVISGGVLGAFITGFILLFLISGIANGSVYKIIPTIWEHKAQTLSGLNAFGKSTWSRSMSGALIGIAGAAGGLGGVGINLVLRSSYKSNQSATQAFWVFLTFYVVAAVVTWWFYARRPIVVGETTDLPVAETAGTTAGTGEPVTKEALA